MYYLNTIAGQMLLTKSAFETVQHVKWYNASGYRI